MMITVYIICLVFLATFLECIAIVFQSRSWKTIRYKRTVLEAVFRGAIISGVAFLSLLNSGELSLFTGKTIWLFMASAFLIQSLVRLLYVVLSRRDPIASGSVEGALEGWYFGFQVISFSLIAIVTLILTVGSFAVGLVRLIEFSHIDIDSFDAIGISLAVLLIVRSRQMASYAHAYLQERV